MMIGVDASRATRSQRTGTETYSAEIIRRLPALVGGHRLRLYTDRPPSGELRAIGAPAEWRVMPFPRLWTHLRLSLEMVRDPPDVLFVPAHVVPLLHPRRCVVTVHDLGYIPFRDAHPTFSRWYLELSTRWNVRVAKRILADSEATRKDLARHYAVDPAKVKVVYPGYDSQRFRPATAGEVLTRVCQRYGISGPYVLFLGTLQPRKNLVRLVEAFAQVETGEARLVIAGQRGWMAGELFRRVESLGLTGRVLFPGYVASEDVPALLAGATLFAFPSLYEGFGLPVLEAMACGTPVICSNAASLPEVAGDAALLVDPRDTAALTWALQRLLGDETLRRELSARGLERARRFSWDSCARQVAEVLSEVGASQTDTRS